MFLFITIMAQPINPFLMRRGVILGQFDVEVVILGQFDVEVPK